MFSSFSNRTLSLALFKGCLEDCLAQSTLATGQLSKQSFVVGFSGGMDSTVLLDLCCQLRDLGVISQLRAVHIHHGLSVYAERWVERASDLCRDLDIPLSIYRVTCNSEQGVEESARNARYEIFERELAPGECLLLGHHQDDQIETQLYRLLRGTGIDGMRGMPQQRKLGRGWLARPLLSTTRADIESWANTHALSWIEDDSNNNLRFDRNFLRTHILPTLQSRWPECGNSFARFSGHCHDAGELLAELAMQDSQSLTQHLTLPGQVQVVALDAQKLQRLSRPRQNLLLRHWLQEQGIPLPSQEILRRIVTEVVGAKVDAEPVVRWAEFVVRRYQGLLIAGQELPEAGTPVVFENGKRITMTGNGQVIARATGLEESKLSRPGSENKMMGAPKTVALKTIEGEWSLRRDVVVAPFALPGRRGHKSLKKWLHELGVAPWLRGRLPVLHQGDQLIAIPGILVADGWHAETDQPGWVLEWFAQSNDF